MVRNESLRTKVNPIQPNSKRVYLLQAHYTFSRIIPILRSKVRALAFLKMLMEGIQSLTRAQHTSLLLDASTHNRPRYLPKGAVRLLFRI
jgi:hypothetical protein